jgi:hypothetical protein
MEKVSAIRYETMGGMIIIRMSKLSMGRGD